MTISAEKLELLPLDWSRKIDDTVESYAYNINTDELVYVWQTILNGWKKVKIEMRHDFMFENQKDRIKFLDSNRKFAVKTFEMMAKSTQKRKPKPKKHHEK